MSSTFIILANGIIEDYSYLTDRKDSWSQATVIAADGGLRHAESLGLTVDYLIGDLDSVDDRRVKELGETTDIEQFPEGKDETDLELALTFAANSGAEAILILGALGGRVDMSLANILLLSLPQLKGIEVELLTGVQTARLLRPPGGDIHGNPGDTVSLIPLLGDVTNITTTNLAYQLKSSSLKAGEVRGVSNVLNARKAHVQIELGTLLVVHTPGRA
jgi:thiamine pyrophosphokinase